MENEELFEAPALQTTAIYTSNYITGLVSIFLKNYSGRQVCMQLRNLRFFVCLRKIAKIARSTIFRVHLGFFAVVSLVNDISGKRVANFAKIAKNRKANDFSRPLAIFRSSVLGTIILRETDQSRGAVLTV